MSTSELLFLNLCLGACQRVFSGTCHGCQYQKPVAHIPSIPQPPRNKKLKLFQKDQIRKNNLKFSRWFSKPQDVQIPACTSCSFRLVSGCCFPIVARSGDSPTSWEGERNKSTEPDVQHQVVACLAWAYIVWVVVKELCLSYYNKDIDYRRNKKAV